MRAEESCGTVKMSTSLAVVTVLLSIVLFACLTEARKDNGEYWKSVAKDEKKRSNCDDTNHINQKKKLYLEDFEPRPNLSSYNDDSKLKLDEKKFAKDIEPGFKANATAYTDDDNDSKLKLDDKKFAKDFEPGPNASAYTDDDNDSKLKIDDKTFAKDFESGPNATAYTDDVSV